jgi:amino acid transporter
MFERFKRSTTSEESARSNGGVATAPARDGADQAGDGRASYSRRPPAGEGTAAAAGAGTATAARVRQRPATRERIAEEADLRRRDEFGGLNWGAAFFGWLVAVGIAALCVAILGAAGTATGLVEVNDSEVTADNETIGIAGGVLLVAILALAYFAGGYVAGRMSRFDGARQGLGVWVIGLLATIAAAVAGLIAGAEYNVLERLDLPRIPVDEGTLTTGGAIALGAILLATLLAALAGGRVGHRYHRRVDAAGYDVR